MRRVKSGLVAGFMAVSAMVTAVGAAGPVAAGSTADPAGCVPVAIMAFRGSGEKPIGDQDYRGQASKGGWEGATLQRLLREYAYSDLWDLPMSQVPIVALSTADGYDAPGVDLVREGGAFTTDMSPVWQGSLRGEGAAVARMNSFQRSQPAYCPKTSWVLVGYSQGAMAARWTQQLVPGRIVSLYLVGDPFQKPSHPSTSGEGANGTGVMRFNYPGMRAQLDRYYDTKPATAVSICHNNDPICDFGTYGIKPHENYFTTAAEKQSEGRVLAGIVRAALDASVVKATTRNVEIMFAIDTTGSMQDYIDDAVASAQSLGDKVLAVSPGSRIGLVEYRDHGDDFVARTVLPLGRDVGAFRAGLAGLVADGGGDTEEAVYSGILEASRAGWSSGSTRAITVLGDAPAHDPESVTGYTAASVATALRTTGARVGDSPAAGRAGAVAPVGTPLVFGLSSDAELSAQLGTVAGETGGGVFDIGDDGTVAELMQKVVEETAAAPQAVVSTGLSIAGQDTIVTGLGSIVGDGPATHEFDLDGDGSYETSAGLESTVSVRLAPGPHRVGVRVTDTKGRQSVAVADTVTLDSAALAATGGTLRGVRVGKRLVAGETAAVGVPVDGSLRVAGLLDKKGRKALASSAVTGEGRISLAVPARLRPGRYRLLVLDDSGARATVAVLVQQRPRLRVSARGLSGTGPVRLMVRAATPVGKPAGRLVLKASGRKVGVARVLGGRGVVTIPRSILRSGKPTKVRVRFVGGKSYATSTRTIRLRARG